MCELPGLPLCCNELFYYDLQISWHNSSSPPDCWIPDKFTTKLCWHSCHAAPLLRYNQSHAICVVRVALVKLFLTSLSKQFLAPQILSIMTVENLGTNVYFTNSWNNWSQYHWNHAGKFAHCEGTIASGRLMYRLRHNRATFWKHREQWRDKMRICVSYATWIP